MPKKAPRNAFYYFMLDFKEQQQKNGIHYENLEAVSKAADQPWKEAPNHVREKFKNMASQKRNVPNAKYTSHGIPLSVIEQQQKEQQDAIEYEKQDIRNMIKLKAFNLDHILDEEFYLMDVNYYCKANDEYVIGESTVLRFSIRNGIRDHYTVKVNPGRIPYGYASDVKENCKTYGLEMPDEENPSNYHTILARTIDYLKKKDKSVTIMPPLYTMPDKVLAVQDFILQLCSKAGEDECKFRIYRVDTLFFTLINAIKSNKNEGFPKESLALLALQKDTFRFSPGLGCDRHEEIDLSQECTTSRTKRWAYSILDSCCPVVGIQIKPGVHVPDDYDIEGIMTYRDQKNERSAPTVAGYHAAPSSCDTSLSESYRDTASYGNSSSVSEPQRKERRTYAPLRMPQADYSKDMRPAPELTEDNFPALSIGGAGRGRGLSGSFNRMNLRK